MNDTSNEAAANPLQRRFAYVTGKGGVGKTTVCAALARCLVERGQRVLVAAPQPEAFQFLLPELRFEPTPTSPDDRLWGVALHAEQSIKEYAALKIGSKWGTRAIMGSRNLQAFLQAVPGLPQWAVLGKAWYHTTERLPTGESRFDVVIFDAPATGHAIAMLDVPRALSQLSFAGPLRPEAQLAWELLKDPARCSIVLTTLAEELPTRETLSLAHQLRAGLGLPLGAVVVNRVCPLHFTRAQRSTLLDELLELGASPAAELVRRGVARASAEQTQVSCLRQLEGIRAPLWELPELPAATTADLEGRARALASHLACLP